MILPLVLAAVLPSVYWDRGADAAEAFRKAGIHHVAVPAAQQSAWRAAGFDAAALDPSSRVKLSAPRVELRMDEASATRVPWIDANGWRFIRDASAPYYCDAPGRAAALAAAEAYAYGVDEAVRPDLDGLPALASMLDFLRRIDRPRLPALANIGLLDDGSEQSAEAMNLMARHNLLFQALKTRTSGFDLVIEPAKEESGDPYEYAQSVRAKLTDDKRLVRLYGSPVVLVRLEGQGTRARLHLINYSGRKVQGLRVRVRGPYRSARLSAFGIPDASLQDLAPSSGALEFSVPLMNQYAVIDLQ